MADGALVVFNTAFNSQSPDILYGAGTFTINRIGNYSVTWWVALDGTATSSFVSFTLRQNGSGGTVGDAPISSGQVFGNALVTVSAVGTTLTLVNTSGQAILLSAIPIQASIVITEVL